MSRALLRAWMLHAKLPGRGFLRAAIFSPYLTPTTYFVLIVSVIGSFKVFNVVYLFTVSGSAGATGGPDNAASTIGFYLWQQAFQIYHAGYAGAISVVFFLFPFYWMLVSSLNRPDTVFEFPPILWPQWQFHNYVEAWQASSWLQF